MLIDTSNITQLKIDNTDVFLEDFGENSGKITISDTYGHNYSMFWGAMGGSLIDFLLHINDSYFTHKLLPVGSEKVFDAKRTFSNVRKYIRDEMDFPYYKEMEFQKNMREVLNDFKDECEDYGDEYAFVNNFYSSFVNRLDFYLIKDKHKRSDIEKNFKETISEHWFFIEKSPSPECIWLVNFHKKLKKELKKLKTC